jgi:hypothetical protein
MQHRDTEQLATPSKESCCFAFLPSFPSHLHTSHFGATFHAFTVAKCPYDCLVEVWGQGKQRETCIGDTAHDVRRSNCTVLIVYESIELHSTFQIPTCLPLIATRNPALL